MCAFWLRARSNHRGTNICVAIFSIRRNESRWSPSTLRISFYGVRFFFEHVLPRDWMSLALARRYFLYRRNESRWSPSTLRISFYGVRFFFEHVLPRDRMSLALLDTRREQRLPAVLSFNLETSVDRLSRTVV